MARVALGRRLDVVGVLAGSVDTVVTGRAIAGDATVIEARHRPGQCVVAAVAGRAGLDVPGALARRGQAIVTLLAAAHDFAVLNARKLRPVLRAVASVAVVRGRHMLWRLAAAGNRRRSAVAGAALHGCTFEPAVDMAGLALDKAVETLQRKPRDIMIKLAGRKSGAGAQQDHQRKHPPDD